MYKQRGHIVTVSACVLNETKGELFHAIRKESKLTSTICSIQELKGFSDPDVPFMSFSLTHFLNEATL